jgi:TRAP-type mannitol/chloroaromatic compound transport system permease small subunit
MPFLTGGIVKLGKIEVPEGELLRGQRMGKKIKKFISLVDAASEKTGKAVSLLIILIMVITMIEVVARYAFNSPTMWAWPINRQLFGVFILFGGAYTLLYGGHIRVEVLYNRFSPKMKSIARLIALACFLVFIGVLVWQGALMAGISLMSGERASGTFNIPLYPFKILIPIAAFLFLLEGIADFLRRKNASNH